MDYDDLEKIMQNLDDQQREAVACFAARLASVSSERWTGELVFALPISQGGISGRVRVNRGETVKLTKKRRVRSSGLKR